MSQLENQMKHVNLKLYCYVYKANLSGKFLLCSSRTLVKSAWFSINIL